MLSGKDGGTRDDASNSARTSEKTNKNSGDVKTRAVCAGHRHPEHPDGLGERHTHKQKKVQELDQPATKSRTTGIGIVAR